MRSMVVPVTLLALILMTAGASGADEPGWTIFPSSDRGKVKEYLPTFEKHFKAKDAALTGSCGLGADFFNERKCSTFEGTGPIWATRPQWPKDAADFELAFDYKWVQAEPLAKFADFPDMTVGLRLNPANSKDSL